MNKENFSEKRGTEPATVDVYDRAAESYSERYDTMGPRYSDIELGFSLCESSDIPFVVEIGPGNGRDAALIIPQAAQYLGVEVSQEMTRLAQERLPDAHFVTADVCAFDFPSDVDIIFSFASLLHLNKEQIRDVLQNAANALKSGGIVYLSLKKKDEYGDAYETDAFGQRHFYYYNRETLEAVTPQELEVVHHDEQHHGTDDWITLVLKKL